MAQCAYCSTTIIFGGKKEGDLRFCNDKCVERGFVLIVADQIPAEMLDEAVTEVHQGVCPACGGPGPIDVQTSHTIWSLLILSSWNSHPQICCGACGTKKKIGATVFSLLFGWWGFPWGILLTPIQIFRNLAGLFSRPLADKPSKALRNILKVGMAADIMEQVAALETNEGIDGDETEIHED